MEKCSCPGPCPAHPVKVALGPAHFCSACGSSVDTAKHQLSCVAPAIDEHASCERRAQLLIGDCAKERKRAEAASRGKR